MQILDAMATRYGTRPSAILGLRDEWAAYQFDLAALAAAGRVSKGPDQSTPAIGLASLAGRARKMKVPENGIW